MIINSYVHASSGATTPSQMLFGYLEGNFTSQVGGSTGMHACFDTDITKSNVEGGLTGTTTSDGELGFDFSWSASAGRKIDKVEVWGSNNNGYINASNPTDVVIYLEGWDGTWNALGDTGTFTDGTSADKKTITSSDTTTLFTKFRILIETATSAIRLLAEAKLYEVTEGLMSFPVIDGANITPGIGASWARGEEVVNGSGSVVLNSSLLSPGATTSDFVIPLIFDTDRPIDKVVVYGSSDHGFIFNTNPTDVQIDLEGWNGSSWDALGDTGTFTDANSLSKTISSSDTTTLYSKARITLSSATNAFRVISDIEMHVFV